MLLLLGMNRFRDNRLVDRILVLVDLPSSLLEYRKKHESVFAQRNFDCLRLRAQDVTPQLLDSRELLAAWSPGKHGNYSVPPDEVVLSNSQCILQSRVLEMMRHAVGLCVVHVSRTFVSLGVPWEVIADGLGGWCCDESWIQEQFLKHGFIEEEHNA